eukprot:gene15299-637_t
MCWLHPLGVPGRLCGFCVLLESTSTLEITYGETALPGQHIPGQHILLVPPGPSY